MAEQALNAFEADAPHSPAALDLLPRALSILSALGNQTAAAAAESDACADQASDACSGYVRRMLQHRWPPAATSRVLQSLRSFPLTAEQLAESVQAAVKRAHKAELHDLPATVHQLLVLSARGCRDLVLQVGAATQ